MINDESIEINEIRFFPVGNLRFGYLHHLPFQLVDSIKYRGNAVIPLSKARKATTLPTSVSVNSEAESIR